MVVNCTKSAHLLFFLCLRTSQLRARAQVSHHVELGGPVVEAVDHLGLLEVERFEQLNQVEPLRSRELGHGHVAAHEYDDTVDGDSRRD